MLRLTFSSRLDWGSNIICIAKTASTKIGAIIHSMKFLSSKVALYLYKSTIRPCLEYCCHVWAGAPSCYLQLLDKLQKRICRTIGLSLAASLEPFAYHWNVVSLSLFCRYYFGKCSSEVAQLVSLPFYRVRSTCYSGRLHDFSVTIPRFYKDVYVDSFFPRTARPWLSAYTMLSFDLSWFRLTDLIAMVLLMWKWKGLFLRKNNILRCWGWPSLLDWIGVRTLSVLLKLPPRKLEL